jgi:hypothetical protein
MDHTNMMNEKEPEKETKETKEANETMMNSNEPGQGSELESHAVSPQGPALELIEKPSRFFADVVRSLLVLLALVVAVGFVLIVLPQPTVDKMTQDLRTRYTTKAQVEKIGLIYLGDEIDKKTDSFHIRGAVRNISNVALSKLDAAVRLYLHDGTVYQTIMVPMDKEVITPDAVGQFDLVYPNYKMQFEKYSVEFNLRDGDLANYKDMRSTANNSPAIDATK